MLTILIDFILVIKIGYANTINTERFLSAFQKGPRAKVITFT